MLTTFLRLATAIVLVGLTAGSGGVDFDIPDVLPPEYGGSSAATLVYAVMGQAAFCLLLVTVAGFGLTAPNQAGATARLVDDLERDSGVPA